MERKNYNIVDGHLVLIEGIKKDKRWEKMKKFLIGGFGKSEISKDGGNSDGIIAPEK